MGSISTFAVIQQSDHLGAHVGTGKLRALAVTTANRSPVLLEVPTVAESGYPGFETNTWQGIVTRAGTPGPLLVRLNTEVVRILKPAGGEKLQAMKSARHAGSVSRLHTHRNGKMG